MHIVAYKHTLKLFFLLFSKDKMIEYEIILLLILNNSRNVTLVSIFDVLIKNILKVILVNKLLSYLMY